MGQHGVIAREPCPRKWDRKGQEGTHLCKCSQPCETNAARSQLLEQELQREETRVAQQDVATLNRWMERKNESSDTKRDTYWQETHLARNILLNYPKVKDQI